MLCINQLHVSTRSDCGHVSSGSELLGRGLRQKIPSQLCMIESNRELNTLLSNETIVKPKTLVTFLIDPPKMNGLKQWMMR